MARTHSEALLVIAVVEDDAPLRQAIRFSLTAEGYAVRDYNSAEELLAGDTLDDVACFVVDLTLPKGSGLTLLRQLQEQGAPGRAVLITTRPTASLRTACRRMGVPIVEKPLLGESLNACIRGLLAKPAAG